MVSPLPDYQALFHLIQTSAVFEDSKTFVDCRPRWAPSEILARFNAQCGAEDFNLRTFVEAHYILPSPPNAFESDVEAGVAHHLARLWPILTVKPGAGSDEGLVKSPQEGADTLEQWQDSLIALPNPYVVPGGRFREIYYWDSYFTLLGLRAEGRWPTVQHMVENFAYLIDTIGYIPNGNRRYYLGRSQPPFFALMVELLAEHQGNDTYITFLPQLKKEYEFWQQGVARLSQDCPAVARVAQLPDGSQFNRFWDQADTPRPESYCEDLHLIAGLPAEAGAVLCRHVRAAAESGWDFSSRWFKDQRAMHEICTTDILPVDLNVLMVHLERTLAKASSLAGEGSAANRYARAADRRASAIQKHFWDEDIGFYRDINLSTQTYTPVLSLAAVYPLFFQLAAGFQARRVVEKLKTHFLQPGGLLTTLNDSGQQWDAPNGWAPLHWLAVQGLRHYGYFDLADEIKQRWVDLNVQVFKRTGKLLEKYNVCDTTLAGGGGEYPVQDGFGWTNGVLMQFLTE